MGVSGTAGSYNSLPLLTTTTNALGIFSFGASLPERIRLKSMLSASAPFWLTPFTITAETDSLNVPINVTGVIEQPIDPVALNTMLLNYPNPFSGADSIVFTVVNANADISLTIYNELGAMVKTLSERLHWRAGTYVAQVNAADILPGVYTYISAHQERDHFTADGCH